MVIVLMAVGLTATAATASLAVSARPAGRCCPAYRMLAVAALVTAVSVLAGLLGDAVPAWSVQRREALAAVVAVGTSLGTLLAGAGFLRLPGVWVSLAVAGRVLLDGVILATAAWFVGWVLLSEPTRLLGAATGRADGAILGATVVTALAVGLVCAVLLRALPPRGPLLRLGGGIVALAVGGLALTAGLGCCTGPWLNPAGGMLAVTGLALLAFAVRRHDRHGAAEVTEIRRDSAYAFVPMAAMALSAMYHLLLQGNFDVYAIVAGSIEGFALVTRQYLALRDVRAYAERLAEREAHFRELAHTDPLTGLANRRGLLRALHHDATVGAPCVLLELDLDGFKHVNDDRGHDVGDAVLVEVGRRLRAGLGPGDVAVRLGGDEFAVLLRCAKQDAVPLAEELLERLNQPYDQHGAPVLLSVSIGMAGGVGGVDVESLLRDADLALRYAKQRGKNRIEHYDLAYDRLLRRRTTLEHEMRGAIARHELRLVFQPVVAVPSVRPVGAEALLRWQHPELGNVRPDEFIPLAEECGMIAKLGAWVLDRACLQLSQWLADGHDVWLSVNVSPREFHAPEYVVQVAEALRRHGVPPQRLVLEVTEHAVADDLDELIRRLTDLRRTGVRIALDDFGAGYSSLGQLRRLPIDILKIDHSLVAEHEPVAPVGQDGPAFAPMVDVVMRLGHQLGLEVIAEGVTNPAELAAVVAAGCRFGQGQLFGWGVPAEHLEAMLKAASSSTSRPVPMPRVLPFPDSPVGAGQQGPAGAGRGPQRRVGTARTGEKHASVDQDVGAVDSSREMRQS